MSFLIAILLTSVLLGVALIAGASLSDRKRINRDRDEGKEKEVKSRWPGV